MTEPRSSALRDETHTYTEKKTEKGKNTSMARKIKRVNTAHKEERQAQKYKQPNRKNDVHRRFQKREIFVNIKGASYYSVHARAIKH